MFKELIECDCVLQSNENVENGLEPYDCAQMEDIHYLEVCRAMFHSFKDILPLYFLFVNCELTLNATYSAYL